MSGLQELLSELTLRADQQDIIIGDDSVMQVAVVGKVAFERESVDPSRLTDVLFVPSLRKNLVPSSCLEDIYFVVLSG